jgi:hypothetical protein
MHVVKIVLFFLLAHCLPLVNASEWQFEELSLSQEDDLFKIFAQSISTPFFDGPISHLNYSCTSSVQIYPSHTCKNGLVSFTYETIEYQFIFSGGFDFANNLWDVSLTNVTRTISIHSDSDNKDKLNIDIMQLPISDAAVLFKQYIAINPDTTSGTISAKLVINTENQLSLDVDYNLSEFSWESDDGQYVFADSELKGDIQLLQQPAGMELLVNTTVAKGEGLFTDIYVLFDEYSITVKTDVSIDNSMQLSEVNFIVSASDDVFFNINIPKWQQDFQQISFNIGDLSLFHKGFIASYLEIMGIDDVDVLGQLTGQMSVRNGEIIAVNADIKEFYLEIESIKTEVEDLNASIKWQQRGEWQTSRLDWQSLLLAGMPINQSQLIFSSLAQQLRLQPGSSIPVFDGSVLINKLELTDLFKPQIAINFDGEVLPISLDLITEKMGWPIMSGSISGKIPGMKKVGHSITFDGSLDIKVFDGQMHIDKLSMERLFGIAPVIAADIDFSELNLQQITSTFDFGEITGLIDGYVQGLRITNWKADRLDAHIQSRRVKGIKQTISQRAIDNISSIGGIQGALSRSFLRFFEYFKYKRIGIGCKLRNSICEMSGIEQGKNSYHIIEGKGIPSINIIGIRKFIDWEVFLDRLLNAGY